jgi:vitamin B12 transporter
MSFLNSVLIAPGLRSASAAAALSVCCVSHVARAAQAVDQTDAAVTPVIVTATRTPTRINDLVADVSVVLRAEIEQASGRTLISLLAGLPGLQMASNGGLGKSSNLYVRGGDPRETLLLIDGVRYGSATTGAPSLDNIPLDLIDHIEVVRGPLASLYGADAAAGVVQIFMRKGGAAGFTPHAAVTVGSDQYTGLSAGFSGGQDKLSYSVNANQVGTTGFSATNKKVANSNHNPDRDGFQQSSLAARAGWLIDEGWRVDGHVLNSAGVTELDDGVAGSGKTTVNYNTDMTSSVAGLALSGRLHEVWHAVWRLSRAEDRSDNKVANKSSNQGLIDTVQSQATWENQVATPVGQVLVVGEHLRQEVMNSTKVFPVTSRTVNAVALGLSGSAGVHAWQVSSRQDHNSQYGTQSTGSLGYALDVAEGWKLGASAGTSFVAPTFNQLYYPGYSNPNLKPEHGLNRELSLKWGQGGQEASLVHFDNRIKDFLLNGKTSVSNVAGVRLNGWTLAGASKADVAWGSVYAGGSLDWLDAHDLSNGVQLDRRADRTASLRVGLTQGAWGGELSTRASDGAFDTVSSKRLRLAGYALWGASVRHAVARDWTLAVRADNIGNHRYETAYGYNQPVSQVFVTLSYAAKSL